MSKSRLSQNVLFSILSNFEECFFCGFPDVTVAVFCSILVEDACKNILQAALQHHVFYYLKL